VALKRKKAGTGDLGRLEYHWVAKILEIRASDHNHVYARIYWMYSGDDLRKAVHGNEEATGQQDFQIPNELIASNHSELPILHNDLHWDDITDEEPQWTSLMLLASLGKPTSSDGESRLTIMPNNRSTGVEH
jgi:hypothetical protein